MKRNFFSKLYIDGVNGKWIFLFWLFYSVYSRLIFFIGISLIFLDKIGFE